MSSRELSELKKIIDEEVPHAFIILVSAREVQGRGFTLKRSDYEWRRHLHIMLRKNSGRDALK
ncbi:DUF2179 domain-containing protein [Eisenbergiella sp.]|uniref:DUF2179 domain-containing protein n=1 Tax=Eisenbergiella sp. TaxID=1924109 RepID=UPI003FA42CC2